MRIEITARHLELSDAVENLLRSKLAKLEKLDSKIISVHAIFGREKYMYTAEVTLSGKGLRLVGKDKHAKDLLTSMEGALAKVERQLKKEEKKRIEPRRRTEHRE